MISMWSLIRRAGQPQEPDDAGVDSHHAMADRLCRYHQYNFCTKVTNRPTEIVYGGHIMGDKDSEQAVQ